MKLSKAELYRIYRQNIAVPSQGRTECLSEELLVRASSGKMTQAEREQVADHLSLCSECAREYRQIRFLQSGCHQATADVQPPLAEAHRRRAAVLWRPAPLPLAITALWLILTLGLGLWSLSFYRDHQHFAATLAARDQVLQETRRQLSEVTRRSQQDATQMAELRRNLDGLSQPQLNAPVIDLDPRDSVRGSSSPGPRLLAIPAAANGFTLILNVESQPPFQDYSLKIVDEKGSTVWSGRGLRKSPFDTFTVALPRRLLPSGDYRIALFGLRGDQTKVVEEYEVRIRYQ